MNEHTVDRIVLHLRQTNRDTILTFDQVTFVKEFKGRRLYECPWCDTGDHWATVDVGIAGLELRPIHCYITGKMWWLDMREGAIIKRALLEEEERFRRHLEQYKDLEGPISPQRAFIMRTGGGCPEELLIELVTDKAEFRRLMEEQRERDRGGRENKPYA